MIRNIVKKLLNLFFFPLYVEFLYIVQKGDMSCSERKNEYMKFGTPSYKNKEPHKVNNGFRGEWSSKEKVLITKR